jgi:hypothetical protein
MQAHLRIVPKGYHTVPDPPSEGMDIAIGLVCTLNPIAREWKDAVENIIEPVHMRVGWLAQQDRSGRYELSAIGPARDDVVIRAQMAKTRYLFFLDDDVLVPFDVLPTLLETMQRLPQARVVAGIYNRRRWPIHPTVWDEKGQPIERWISQSQFLCGAIGTGCMLIDMRVFQQIPFPWFDPSPDEDIAFCCKVRAMGFQVVADSRILCPHLDTTRSVGIPPPTGE